MSEGLTDQNDLPPELLAQLKGYWNPERPMKMSGCIQLIREIGGAASTDDIVIAAYRKAGVVIQRKKVAGVLRQLRHRGFLKAQVRRDFWELA